MIRLKINGDFVDTSRMPVTKRSLFIVRVNYLHPKRVYTAEISTKLSSFYVDFDTNPGLRKWWKLRMLHGPEIPRVESTDLAVSRRNSILYMTGHNTHDLFSINLERIRTNEVLWTVPSRVRVKSSYFFGIHHNDLHICNISAHGKK